MRKTFFSKDELGNCAALNGECWTRPPHANLVDVVLGQVNAVQIKFQHGHVRLAIADADDVARLYRKNRGSHRGGILGRDRVRGYGVDGCLAHVVARFLLRLGCFRSLAHDSRRPRRNAHVDEIRIVSAFLSVGGGLVPSKGDVTSASVAIVYGCSTHGCVHDVGGQSDTDASGLYKFNFPIARVLLDGEIRTSGALPRNYRAYFDRNRLQETGREDGDDCGERVRYFVTFEEYAHARRDLRGDRWGERGNVVAFRGSSSLFGKKEDKRRTRVDTLLTLATRRGSTRMMFLALFLSPNSNPPPPPPASSPSRHRQHQHIAPAIGWYRSLGNVFAFRRSSTSLFEKKKGESSRAYVLQQTTLRFAGSLVFLSLGRSDPTCVPTLRRFGRAIASASSACNVRLSNTVRDTNREIRAQGTVLDLAAVPLLR